MAPQDKLKQYPLYNTTFTLHRLSPLYTGSSALRRNTSLRNHARQFREVLTGEVLRGVRVGMAGDDNVLTRVGALQTVTWKELPEEGAWDADDDKSASYSDATVATCSSRGMCITVTYEKMEYRAILLRQDHENLDLIALTNAKADDGFHNFPLILSKMPNALWRTLEQYLTTNFDARVSDLHLSSSYLTESFDIFIADLVVGENGELLEDTERFQIWRDVIKETVISLGFDLPSGSAALKTIDIQLKREDLPRMIASGQSTGKSPFFDALATYMKGHLALDLRNSMVKIVKIACGAFVLGAQGKLKLSQFVDVDSEDPKARATRRFMNWLVQVAARGALSRENVS